MRLPDFIGVGAPRCGTTWLAHILNQHPEIYMDPQFKEIHFFDNNFGRGVEWYARFFEGIPREIKCGEFTPSYIYPKDSFAKIHALNPETKLIVNLRDPVHRAFSHYMQRKRYIGGMDDFEKTVKMNVDHILDFGEYGKQLEEIYKLFSEEQVHIIIFEEMIRNPQKVIAKLLVFLGVSTLEIAVEKAPKNQMSTVRFVALKQLARGLRSLARKHHGFRKVFFRYLNGEVFIAWLREINSSNKRILKETLTPELESFLVTYYASDRVRLEQLLKKPLLDWHDSTHGQLAITP
ncbi:MAG: sulfotransferase domain-containing protein [Candidatus Marinimicrobia bacterium]|nr:sulfotransferase domain-containing protein [Candidatus Neomarinimicrobiota bacterium]